MSEGRRWVARQVEAAPPRLSERVLAWYDEPGEAAGEPEQRLARAAERALRAALKGPGDRRVALDLLAADGLVTLALLRQAELAPDALGGFAATLLAPGGSALARD